MNVNQLAEILTTHYETYKQKCPGVQKYQTTWNLRNMEGKTNAEGFGVVMTLIV